MPGKKAPPKTAVEKAEIKKGPGHSARLKTDKKTKAYFLQIFPKFTREEWDKIVKEHGAKKQSVAIVHNGFTLTFDPTKISDDPKKGWTYERYLESYEVIEKSLPLHRRSLKKSHAKAYKKASQAYDPYRRSNSDSLDIQTRNFPKTKEKLRALQNELKDLKKDDEFFICAHGNPKLLGVGPFTMEGEEIAHNIEHLGLAKKEVPAIILFACESAKLRFKKTLIKEVKDSLIKAEYEHPVVMGTLGLLVHSYTKPSYVGEHQEGNRDEYVPIKGQVIGAVSTPKTEKIIDELQQQNARPGGLFTQIRTKHPHRFSFGTPPSTPLGMKWVPKNTSNDNQTKQSPPQSPQVVKAKTKQDAKKTKAARPVANPTRAESVPSSPAHQTNTTTKKKQARTTSTARSNTTTTLFPTNQNQTQPANRRVTRAQTGKQAPPPKRYGY